MIYVISAIIGYLIGSINPSILISKIYKTDIRKHGSGNAGATNVLRTFGKGAAIAVTLIDISKGMLAILVTRLLFGVDATLSYISGLGAILGHNFPLYFGFHGGKGILTSFGILLVLDYRVALSAFAVEIIVIAATRYVSLGSVLAALFLPVAALLWRLDTVQVIILLVMGLLAIFMHRSNIVRLVHGNERKLGEKSDK